MDAQRFDNLARTLASRLSRRRAGAVASVSLLAAAGIRPDQAAALARAQNDGQPLYTLIRRYTLTAPSDQVRQALQQGYVADACNAAGFVAYLTVEGEDGVFATVAVFRSQNDLENFANAETNRVAQTLNNLLPTPDEEIYGNTFVHAATQQGFPSTCPAATSPPAPTAAAAQAATGTTQPTAAPAQPTAAPAPPTAAPTDPTPTPIPACTGHGCACATGTQSPCDNGLVCCGTTGTPGGPGLCITDAECNPPCSGQGCGCSGGVQGACDEGFVCCQNGVVIPGGAGSCQPESQCAPAACTGEGCSCTPGASGGCGSDLVCCPGTSSAGSTCTTAAECAATPCKGHYCYCPGGVEAACGEDLVCCSATGTPGGDGVCLTQDECNPSCNGQGCGCSGGVEGACDEGFVCCQDGLMIAGGAGTCQPSDACSPPACSDNGVGCSDSCATGPNCVMCCTGYCNSTGVCDNQPQNTCISDGVNCGPTCNWSDGCDVCCSGFCDGAGNCNEPGASAGACGDEGCGCELANPACVEGLLCCDDGSGVTGTCLTGC